jgi:acyl-CoA synthetase (AMP-forming)/AMP-acid ligase II
MGLRDFTLFDVVARNARLYPNRPAFVFANERVTHAAYLVRVERLAAGLSQAGIEPGDRIALSSQNNPEFVDLYGAAARLGAIVVPINWRLSAEEIAYVVGDAAPKVVISDAANQQVLQGAQPALSTVKHWYGIGGNIAPFAPYTELLESGAARAGSFAAPHSDADAGFVMIHTAAVGGRPRGALLSHANLIAASVQLLHHWSLTPEDVNLGPLPLFHVAGLGMLLAAQHAGGASIVMPKFDAETALSLIQDERVTMLAEFPPILTTLLDAAESRPKGLSSLRIATGLDSPETIARFERRCPDARFWSVFGQSETSGFVTMGRFRDKPGAAGKPTVLATVAVLDEADKPVTTGEIGEIAVRGPTVFKGYWQCEADTAFTFRNGWPHTGDQGAFDAEGILWYKGRSPAKELIKPGGENVYPAEVEREIAAHPAIAEVVVLGVPDAQWGEAVKAVCSCKPGQTATAQQIIDFVGGRIARYKRPKYVEFVGAMPKTEAGAVDRAKVKETHGRAV